MKRLFVIGLLLKLIVSVLAEHGDLWFIWSRPADFLNNIDAIGSYYPPLAYVFFGVLSPMYSLSSFVGGWVLKMPYIPFDGLILYLLLRMNSRKQQKKVLFLWWFSPVVLFATYAQGQLEIIPAALMLWSIYVIKKRQRLSGFLYSLSIAFKTIPVFALLPLTLAIRKNWLGRIRWLLGGLSSSILLGGMFWLGTKADVINSYFPKIAMRQLEFNVRPDVALTWVSLLFGLALYAWAVRVASKRNITSEFDCARLILVSLAAVFIANPANLLHRFVLIIPILVYVLIRENWSTRWIWFFSLCLFLGYAYTWPLEWGLFVKSFPQVRPYLALREWAQPVVNYEHVALAMRLGVSGILLRWGTMALRGIDRAKSRLS